MKHCETTKLFYDEYLYKISLTNSLAAIFREKNLPSARKILDGYKTQLDNEGRIQALYGSRTKYVSYDSFISAQSLYLEFTAQNQDNYKLRIEHPGLAIYSNDLYWIEYLEKKLDNINEVWKPKDSTSLAMLEPNVIISNAPIEFEYKVTVGSTVDPSFPQWVRKNRDKVKAGRVFLNLVETKSYVKGMYFYCRDMKILQFVNIIIGGSVRRVDKFINKPDNDK